MAKVGNETEVNPASSGQIKTTNNFELFKIECKQIIDDMSNEIYKKIMRLEDKYYKWYFFKSHIASYLTYEVRV